MANFCVFSASRAQHISYVHSKFTLRPRRLWRSMADIQSATAENRRGKKEERRNHSDRI